jgi:phage terminase large subunit-like protein
MGELQDWRDRRPIDFYEPAGIPQENFHKSLKTLRVLLGSNNSGKTTTGGVEAIYFATGKHPYRGKIEPAHGWVTSVDFATSKFVVEKKFFEWCPKEEIKSWYEKDRLVELYNGSTIQFKSADSGREKFQGQRIRWAWIDEEVDRDIFEEIQARQMSNQDLDIWMTLTPLKGLTWIYNDIFEVWEEYQSSLTGGK